MKIFGMVTCSLLLAAFVGVPRAHGGSNGKTSEAVRGFVQGFYNWYVPEALKTQDEPVWNVALKYKPSAFSPALLRALKEDSEAQAKANGEIVGLDFDPLLNTQDPCDRYEVGAVTHHEDRYLVEVYGVCAGKRNQKPDVIAEVARREGSWAFVNFHYPTIGRDLLSTLRTLREGRRKSRR